MPRTRRDLRALEIAVNFGKFIVVTPFHNYLNPTRPSARILNTIFALLLSCFLLSGTAWSMHRRHMNLFKQVHITHIILDYINESSLVLISVSAILSSIINARKWTKLGDQFAWIDRELNSTAKETRASAYAELFLAHCCCFFVYIYFSYVWVYLGGISVFETFTFRYINYYYEFYVKFLYYMITITFQHRYENLNREMRSNFDSDRHGVVQMITRLPNEPKKSFNIRKFEVIVRSLSDMVNTTNRIYGWPLVFVTVRTIGQVLACLNYIMTFRNNSNEKVDERQGGQHFLQNLTVAGIILALSNLVATIIIIMSCDLVVTEAKKMVYICNRIQEKLPEHSGERFEFLRLVKYSADNMPFFSAAGFFTLNRSTLSSLIGTTTTYFIVVIQFSNY